MYQKQLHWFNENDHQIHILVHVFSIHTANTSYNLIKWQVLYVLGPSIWFCLELIEKHSRQSEM